MAIDVNLRGEMGIGGEHYPLILRCEIWGYRHLVEVPRPSRQDGTGPGLPGHVVASGKRSKGNMVLIVPPDPAYQAELAEGHFRANGAEN